MTRANQLTRAKRWVTKSPMLLASIAAHAVVLLVLLVIFRLSPGENGANGVGEDGQFSATWFVGTGKGQGRPVDTAVPDAEAPGSLDGADSVKVQSVAKQGPVLDVLPKDPQAVFNSESDDSFESITEQRPVGYSQNPTEAEKKAVVTPKSTAQTSADTNAKLVSHRKSSAFDNDSSSSESMAEGGAERGSSHGDGASGLEDDDAAGGTAKAGDTRIQFFGIFARGKRVVYVIDASESMRQYHAMELARKKLWSSLQDLGTTSQFQIVFFNLTNHTMSREGERPRLLPATFSNRRLAKQFLMGIQPDSGTDRFAAMSYAMSLEPDVVFLLTDADEPGLSAKDLFEIRRLNKRRAAVHVVEFGVGADLNKDSFLKKLTRQNGGLHQYHDLTKSE